MFTSECSSWKPRRKCREEEVALNFPEITNAVVGSVSLLPEAGAKSLQTGRHLS